MLRQHTHIKPTCAGFERGIEGRTITVLLETDPSYADSSKRLNELTERAVTIEVPLLLTQLSDNLVLLSPFLPLLLFVCLTVLIIDYPTLVMYLTLTRTI